MRRFVVLRAMAANTKSAVDGDALRKKINDKVQLKMQKMQEKLAVKMQKMQQKIAAKTYGSKVSSLH